MTNMYVDFRYTSCYIFFYYIIKLMFAIWKIGEMVN